MSDKFEIQADLLYTKDHEWARQCPDGTVEIGISTYAVDQLGDITLVNLDVREGDAVTVGKAFGTIESVKTLSDLFSPVSGKVLRINKELETGPEIVNDDCYTRGWMIAVQPSEPLDKDRLLSAEAYRQLLQAETH